MKKATLSVMTLLLAFILVGGAATGNPGSGVEPPGGLGAETAGDDAVTGTFSLMAMVHTREFQDPQLKSQDPIPAIRSRAAERG